MTEWLDSLPSVVHIAISGGIGMTVGTGLILLFNVVAFRRRRRRP